MIGRTLLLLVVVLLGALPGLAQASPPDQTWHGGLYDDDDFDDVILIITSLSGAVDIAPTSMPRHGGSPRAFQPHVTPDPEVAHRTPAYLRRAPPSI